MTVLREYSEFDRRCVVRSTSCAGNTMADLSTLFSEAKADFPTLRMQDAEPKVYGRASIEFSPPQGQTVPASYKRVASL